MKSIVVRELKFLSASRTSVYAAIGYPALLAFVWVLRSLGGSPTASLQEQAQSLAVLIAAIQTMVLLFSAPLVGVASIARERDQDSWHALLGSSISRNSIAIGKAFASWIYVIVVMSLSLPFATICLMSGGMDLNALIGIYLSHSILAAALVTSGAALAAAIPQNPSPYKLALGLTVAGVVLHPLIFFVLASQNHLEVFVSLSPISSFLLFSSGDQSTGNWLWHYLAMSMVMIGAFAVLRNRLQKAQYYSPQSLTV